MRLQWNSQKDRDRERNGRCSEESLYKHEVDAIVIEDSYNYRRNDCTANNCRRNRERPFKTFSNEYFH